MKYSDKCDVVLLIRLRHLPRFRDDDRWERMVTDIGIDDEGNALRNLFTLVSDTRSTHFLSLSNVSVSDTKVAKTLFRWRLSGALCSAYPISIFSGWWWRIDGVSISNNYKRNKRRMVEIWWWMCHQILGTIKDCNQNKRRTGTKLYV